MIDGYYAANYNCIDFFLYEPAKLKFFSLKF